MSYQVAERLARQVRDCLPVARCLPVDVHELARQLGVVEIMYESDLVEDGRLELRGGKARVFLATRANRHRRRFTLAHELAHLLLAEPRQDTIARRMRTDNEIERFCDDFAAALLLPRHLILDDYAKRPPVLSTVRHLAARTDTSMAAATVRLSQVAQWPHALLHWKRTDSTWRYRWGAGVPAELHRRLRSAPETSAHLEILAAQGTKDQYADIAMHTGHATISLRCEISIRARSAIALAVFPRS